LAFEIRDLLLGVGDLLGLLLDLFAEPFILFSNFNSYRDISADSPVLNLASEVVAPVVRSPLAFPSER
jgi:hypothetical protein